MAEDSEHPEDQVRGARGEEDEALIGQYAAIIGQGLWKDEALICQ